MFYKTVIKEFIDVSREIIADKLTGIYLHGSMAMNCFNPEKSDIDSPILTLLVGSGAFSPPFPHAVRLNTKMLNARMILIFFNIISPLLISFSPFIFDSIPNGIIRVKELSINYFPIIPLQ
jgi:hypothetical protein